MIHEQHMGSSLMNGAVQKATNQLQSLVTVHPSLTLKTHTNLSVKLLELEEAWYGDTRMPLNWQNLANSLDTNWGPLSETIVAQAIHLLRTSFFTVTVCVAVVDDKSIITGHLECGSTAIKNICPWNLGTCKTKMNSGPGLAGHIAMVQMCNRRRWTQVLARCSSFLSSPCHHRYLLATAFIHKVPKWPPKPIYEASLGQGYEFPKTHNLINSKFPAMMPEWFQIFSYLIWPCWLYRGLWKVPGREQPLEVAVKLPQGNSDGNRLMVLQEVAILGQFNHPRVTRLCGLFTLGNPVWGIYTLTKK